MTHFSTLVICKSPDDVVRLLAPYDENIEVPAYLDEDGDESTYNPMSKWDWWVVGGRWPNKLLARAGAETIRPEPSAMGTGWDGVRCAGARKRDLDWEGMAQAALNDGFQTWDAAMADTANDPRWRHLAYGVQPGDDRDSYAQRFVRFTVGALLTPVGALLTPDGEWHEQGRFGWWGHQDEGIGEDAWAAETKRLIDAADDDDWFVIVDCHI